jgi:hypothetical protein
MTVVPRRDGAGLPDPAAALFELLFIECEDSERWAVGLPDLDSGTGGSNLLIWLETAAVLPLGTQVR